MRFILLIVSSILLFCISCSANDAVQQTAIPPSGDVFTPPGWMPGSMYAPDNGQDSPGTTDPGTGGTPNPVPPQPGGADTHTFSSSGSQATETFDLSGGLLRVSFSHEGSSNFIVWLQDGEGNNEELIVNEIGSLSGSRAFDVSTGTYLLEIDANGAWQVEVSQASENPVSQSQFQGSGIHATALFSLESGSTVFSYSYEGASNFIVWLLDSSGNQEKLIVNEIGSISGSEPLPLAAGNYLLDIYSSGDWQISIDQS